MLEVPTAAGRHLSACVGPQVVSNKMMKSVTVAVTRMFRHARLDKTVRETKKYMARAQPRVALSGGAAAPSRFATLSALCCAQAHDELNACGPGDLVRLTETRPLSRHKRCVACLRLTSSLRAAAHTRSHCSATSASASQLDCRGDSETGTHVRAGRCSARAGSSRKSARSSSARGSVRLHNDKPGAALLVYASVPNARSPASPSPGTMRPRSSSTSSIMATNTRRPVGSHRVDTHQAAHWRTRPQYAPGYDSDRRLSAGGAATTPTTRMALISAPRASSASRHVHREPPAAAVRDHKRRS